MRLPRLISTLLAVLFCLAYGRPAGAADTWLKLRRKGAGAVVAQTRAALAPISWRARWRVVAARGAALHGTVLEITRVVPGTGAAQHHKSDKRGREGGKTPADAPRVLPAPSMITVIRLRGGPLDGVGLATERGKTWVRLPGDKAPREADGQALFTPLPQLGVPLALFAVPELSHRYDARIEGEFDGTAVVLLTPRYTDGAGLERLKIGVSKRFLVPTVAELTDPKGDAVHRLLWLETRLQGKLVVAGRLRVRTLSHKTPLDFEFVGLEQGAAVDRAPTGRAALR